jgi:hypothetical protein
MTPLPHPIVGVTNCRQVGTYALYLEFDDGAVRTIDFEPILHGRVFGPLRDPALFAQVRLDPEIKTLVWPNDADFDPATLRYWSEYLPHFLARAEG